MIRVALFASGQGSNALHLLESAKALPKLEIPVLIVDQTSSPLPQKVKKLYPAVEVCMIEKPSGPDKEVTRALHEQQILTVLKTHQIDWCFLAGYMRIIGPTLLAKFTRNDQSRIVNIHPSLLPAYPGLAAYERAFAANEKLCGATVHLVDGGIDTGPIIAQSTFERMKHESLEEFKERGKNLEWTLYADILRTLHDAGDLKPLRKT